VGVVQSLGARGDNESTELLGKLLGHDDAQVRAAAATSLGMIGNVTAAKHLTEALSSELKISSLTDACLECAGKLVASDKQQAVALYDALREANVPTYVKRAASVARYTLVPEEAAPWLKQQLLMKETDDFEVALTAARQVPGAEVTSVLAESLPLLSAERQALVLRAMGDREENVPIALLKMAAGADESELQQAAIDVMAKQADEASLKALVDIAFGNSPAAGTALTKLQTVKSADADKVIVAKAKEGDIPATVAMAELIAARRLGPLKDRLAGWMSHENAELRSAAVFGMGIVGDQSDLDTMVEAALKGSGDQKATAQQSLRVMALRLPDREAAAARLAAEFSSADADQQAYLLSLLREMGGKTALEVAAKAAKSDDARLKELGTKELGAWPNAEAAPLLLDLAKNDKDSKYRIRALRGYIRIGRQFQLSNDERMEYFAKAMEVAERADEKQVAFKILEKVPTTESLELCMKSMDDQATGKAAAEAAVRIGGKVLESNPMLVREAMDKALDSGLEGDLVTTARQLRRKARETAGQK
jgi:HEAT repeat protein